LTQLESLTVSQPNVVDPRSPPNPSAADRRWGNGPPMKNNSGRGCGCVGWVFWLGFVITNVILSGAVLDLITDRIEGISESPLVVVVVFALPMASVFLVALIAWIAFKLSDRSESPSEPSQPRIPP
jgi:hypothetical protein